MRISSPVHGMIERIYNARRVTVRYHGDADGISAALMLYEEIPQARFALSRAPVYSREMLFRDLATLSKHDLLVLLDFGSSDASYQNLRILAEHTNVLVIDHHFPEYDAEFLLNPWKEGKNSDWTTGYYLNTLLDGRYEDLARISVAGDRTGITKTSEEDKKKATVLDYAGVYNTSINFFDRALREPLLSELYHHHELALDALFDAIRPINQRFNGYSFSFLDISDWPEPYPGRGHVANYLLDRGADVVVVVRGRGFSVRTRLDIDLLRVLKLLRRGGYLRRGGGHPKAIAGYGTTDILIQLKRLIKCEVREHGQ